MCLYAADVVFLLDSSTSVTEPNFETMLEFVSGVVQRLGVDSGIDRVAVATYLDDAVLHESLNQYQTSDAVRRRVVNIRYRPGYSNLAVALETIHENVFGRYGDRPQAPNILVVVTDGIDNEATVSDVRRKASALRGDGVYIITVPAAYEGSVQNMKKIASKPANDYVFRARTFDDLASLQQRILDRICQGRCSSYNKKKKKKKKRCMSAVMYALLTCTTGVHV